MPKTAQTVAFLFRTEYERVFPPPPKIPGNPAVSSHLPEKKIDIVNQTISEWFMNSLFSPVQTKKP